MLNIKRRFFPLLEQERTFRDGGDVANDPSRCFRLRPGHNSAIPDGYRISPAVLAAPMAGGRERGVAPGLLETETSMSQRMLVFANEFAAKTCPRRFDFVN